MRRTGYHYETVRKYLDLEDFNIHSHPTKESAFLLDPLKPAIDQWLLDDLKAPDTARYDDLFKGRQVPYERPRSMNAARECV
jgi:hypothetical protein